MIRLKLFVFIFGLLLCGLYSSCKTRDVPSPVNPLVPEILPPVSEPAPKSIPVKEADPVVSLSFERIEAKNTEHITLYFLLNVDNPRSAATDMEIQEWYLQINDQKSEEGANLLFDSDNARIAAFDSAQFQMQLQVDLQEFSNFKGKDFDEYQTELEAAMVFTFDTGDTSRALISTEAVFPRIQEPEFIITTIIVSQGELINTRLRVSLQINNHNIFPVELSSLKYKLYGDGQFWADGKRNAVLRIPAKGSVQTQVSMLMNFIDMNQKLLKDIINMRRVYYRFTGETEVLTNIVYLPQFQMDFDLSGNSEVED